MIWRRLFGIVPKRKVKFPLRKCHSGSAGAAGGTIFSGIQPTGGLHLGNYLGAIQNWVKLQEGAGDAVYCIVDMHAITLPYDHERLSRETTVMAAILLACGIDPGTGTTLYRQSQVLEHASLCWILACLTTLPRLGALPQYKEKAARFTNKSVPTGLFIYPVLQAADILLHRATHVPVGEDQVQHISLSSHLARLFNSTYGETFPIPKALIQASARIKSLRKPLQKMSKSDQDPRGRIELLDAPEVVREKIKKAVTDTTSAVYFDPEARPGVSNLMTIHSTLTGDSYDRIEEENRGRDTGEYKELLSQLVIESLTPIRGRALELLDDRGYLIGVIREGNERARARASDTLSEVYRKVGFNSS